MALDYVLDAVHVLKSKYGNISPLEMVQCLGILVNMQHFGECTDSFRGFAIQIYDKLHITINLDQNERMVRVCLAHELGHCVLHPYSAAAQAFTEIAPDNTMTTEYEASLFAAEYLIEDSDILPLCHEGNTVQEIASILRYPPELVSLKIKALIHKGLGELLLPDEAHGDFLGT